MRIRKPRYYDAFHCIAGACPDSCCQEWEVDIDADTAQKYLDLSGELGETIRAHLMQEDGDSFLKILPNGRCPMWRQDGLCCIQAELGEQALSRVCTQFPRLVHDYGSFQDYGLELSCPEAARLILNQEPEMLHEEKAIPEEDADYDADLMTLLRKSREEALALLRLPLPVNECLCVLLLYGAYVQSQIDGVETGDFDAIAAFRTAKQFAEAGNAETCLSFFKGLDILRSDWLDVLSNPNPDRYWQEEYRNLAAYFIERYYLQAVSDWDLLGRVKMLVLSCVVIHTLGGNMETTAQKYSKEIENSTENMDALLDAVYENPLFTDRKLLGYLLENK